MVKHTQTIRRQQLTSCMSLFDHFVGLGLKALIRAFLVQSPLNRYRVLKGCCYNIAIKLGRCNNILATFFYHHHLSLLESKSWGKVVQSSCQYLKRKTECFQKSMCSYPLASNLLQFAERLIVTNTLTHFKPMFHFRTPGKHLETSELLTF